MTKPISEQIVGLVLDKAIKWQREWDHYGACLEDCDDIEEESGNTLEDADERYRQACNELLDAVRVLSAMREGYL